jgi:UDP-N-acetylmuramoyl-tripeptide--D-alanyl-D-alanine ligase
MTKDLMALSELAKIIGAPFSGEDKRYQQISIDTRTLRIGDVYVAIVGHSLDGHNYVEAAVAAGASALIVDREIKTDCLTLLVEDTTVALGQIAQHHRAEIQASIFAVTGSVGKTTTRNMLTSICNAVVGEAAVLSPEKNFNNQWGLPLTLNRLRERHRFAVLEFGMNHLDEITYLTKLAKPDVAIITCACESHLEFLGSMDNIAKAKGEIFQGLSKEGVAVINADDAYSDYWKSLLSGQRVITFGRDRPSDVSGVMFAPGHYRIDTPQGQFQCRLKLLGEHNLMNALAATAAAIASGFSLSRIQKGLEAVQPEAGRMEPKEGLNGACLIDDTYNAAPDAMRAAIKTLGVFPGEKIFVMGDMAELGDREAAIHQEMGQLLSDAGIDELLTFGTLSQQAHTDFKGEAKHFTQHVELITALEPQLNDQTAVLVKGASRMNMGIIVQSLLRNKR